MDGSWQRRRQQIACRPYRLQPAHYDLIIAGIASLSLILLIMMFITRSLVAALVIVGTVALSLGLSLPQGDRPWIREVRTPEDLQRLWKWMEQNGLNE